MANVELVRLPDGASSERMIRVINSLIDVFLGNDGGRVLMVGHDGTSTDPNLGTNTGTGLYQTVVRSSGTNHLQVRKSDDSANRLTVTDTATTSPDIVATTTLAAQGTSVFTGAETHNGAATFNAASTFNALATVNAGATFTAGQTVTGNGTVQFKTPLSAAASADLVLTASYQAVAGCSLSLTPGIWLVSGVFCFVASGAGDVGQFALGRLVTSGGTASIALPTSIALLCLETATTSATVIQVWLVTVTVATTATLQASKTAGTGASYAQQIRTTITAINA